MRRKTPTEAFSPGDPCREYVTLAQAFDHFNKRLFAGELPHAFITLQRHAKFRGYHWEGKFEARAGAAVVDEIALNPDAFIGRSDAEILSTLVHEMVHLWQGKFGKPSRSGYHNHEWADQMEVVGLMPSDTGRPGGRRVGQSMTHYIVAGGRFEVFCADLLSRGSRLQWQSRPDGPKKAKGRASKTKYTCPVCGLNAWAKPDVHLVCGECEEDLLPEDLAGDA